MHARKLSADNESFEDLYDLLGVSQNAAVDEIKAKYRALQRQYHPDIAGTGSAEMSARLNRAYDVLTDRKARITYDGLRRQQGYGAGSALQAVEGLVGPVRERALPLTEESLNVGSSEAAVDWLQQWGSTFAFGCEMPFRTPLQVDRVPAGVRIAFISVARGSVASLGALYLEVDEGAYARDGVARVAVTRVSPAPDAPLPGESLVLRTLRSALRSKMHRRGDLQLQGFWAALASSSLGFLPLLNFGNQDTAYDAYQIPSRCDPLQRPQEEVL